MNPLTLAPAATGAAGHATSPIALSIGSQHRPLAPRLLQGAATLWCTTAILGQLLFALYVLLFYGRAAAQGRLQDWNKVLGIGYMAGADYHNAILSAHLLFAELVMVGGALQLIPAIRRRWPLFHRWNGRFYVLGAMVAAISGLTMVWTTGAVGDRTQHLAISLNALLILCCASLAWGHAMARRFDTHRRWALRLFLAVNGVWFFRIGLTLWLALNRGPAGFNPKTFTGPFLSFLSFAQFLLPLLFLQLYFHAQRSGQTGKQVGVAAILLALTLATAAGTAAAAVMLWLPHL